MKKIAIGILICSSLISISSCRRSPGQVSTDDLSGGVQQPQYPVGSEPAPTNQTLPYNPVPGNNSGNPYGNPADPYQQGGQQSGYDPMTGQPIGANGATMNPDGINPQLDSGASLQIVNKIQQAGGYKGFRADNVAVKELKNLGMSISQAFQHAPLEHRALIVKTLLDGIAFQSEKDYARQIWSTIIPAAQQRLLSQDSALSKLIRQKLGGGS